MSASAATSSGDRSGSANVRRASARTQEQSAQRSKRGSSGSAAAGIPRPATSGDGEPESEYDDEEFYMIATLPAGAVSRARSAAAGREGEGDGRPLYALIDMDSERPLLELDGNIYQGVKDELLGTAMVFDLAEGGSDDEGGGGDDVDDDGESGEMDARLVGMTSQVVAFHPVRLSKK